MWTTVVLLAASNTFMTIAWYAHLRHRGLALWTAVVLSWLIAFVEYAFHVPANRIGRDAGLSFAQLKTIQEVITLIAFVVFAWAYLGEAPGWNVIVGFLVMLAGATLIFKPW